MEQPLHDTPATDIARRLLALSIQRSAMNAVCDEWLAALDHLDQQMAACVEQLRALQPDIDDDLLTEFGERPTTEWN